MSIVTPVRLTSGDIRRAMATRWRSPEWAVLWEVATQTGATARQRYADAVMMSLWPSRGLELHGVEIKISRSDWKREAADPSKAESIAKYCDRWWVHTSPGVIDDLSDLPPAWGLREWSGKQWRTLREAEKTPAEPMSRGFLAALLRRADESVMKLIKEGAEKVLADELSKIQDRVETQVEARTRNHRQLQEKVAAFEVATGIELGGWLATFEIEKIGRLAKALATRGFSENHYSIAGQLKQIKHTLEQLEREVDVIARLGADEGAS